MKTLFTPGLWMVSERGRDSVETKNILVCDCFHPQMRRAEIKANAHLIAASPEMYESLLAIIELGKRDLSNPKYDEYFIAAKAALTKAQGGQQ